MSWFSRLAAGKVERPTGSTPRPRGRKKKGIRYRTGAPETPATCDDLGNVDGVRGWLTISQKARDFERFLERRHAGAPLWAADDDARQQLGVETVTFGASYASGPREPAPGRLYRRTGPDSYQFAYKEGESYPVAEKDSLFLNTGGRDNYVPLRED